MKISDQAKKSLAKVVEKSASTIDEAIDAGGKLVKENAKELVREIIVYEGYVNNAFGLVGATITAYILSIAFAHVPLIEDGGGRVFSYAGLTVASIVVSIWFLCTLNDIVKARFAPRLFLISYAANLIKKDEPTGSKK